MEKTAFVTGADRGLGYCLTDLLLKEGYRVFASRYIRDWDWLDRLKESCGDRLYIVDLDVSDQASVDEAVGQIKARTDSLDLLINNAGIAGSKDEDGSIFDEIDYDDVTRIYQVNTLGALRVTQGLVDLVMNSRDKLIVNISSEAGSIGRCYRTGWFSYAMAKAALNMQSAMVHNAIYKKGGQVLVIHPGWLKTYMLGHVNEEADFPPEKAASDIYGLILRKDEFKADSPAFLDHLGNHWPW